MATEEEIAAEEDKDPTPRMRRRVAELRSGGKLVARREEPRTRQQAGAKGRGMESIGTSGEH